MEINLLKKLKNLFSPYFYKEIYRKNLYYFYEHVNPLKEMNSGKNLEIHPTTTFRFGKNITLGDGVVIDSNCALWASENSRITVGENTGIGPNTVIVSSNHSFLGRLSYKDQSLIEKDINIEKNVWIGANSVILAGVTIAEGAIIGAGSIISKDVPKFNIVVPKNRDLVFIERR